MNFEFDWDPDKDRSNQRKHGIDFVEAQTVFFDDNALLLADLEHSEREERFLLLGMSVALRVLVVVHCYRESQGRIRLISARRATPNERKVYEERLP